MRLSNRNLIVLVSLLLLTVLFIGTSMAEKPAVGNTAKIVPGKFVVKFKPSGLSNKANQSAVSRITGGYAVQNLKQVFSEARNIEVKEKLNLDNVYIMETAKSSDIWQIVKDLQNDPAVEYAEPVYLNQMDAIPNDSLYSLQHFLPQVSAPEAWDIGYGSSDVIIGVIDTGVDWDHEDLVDVIWSNEDEVLDGTDTDGNGYIDDIRGWDFVTGVSGDEPGNSSPIEDGEVPDNDPMDVNGHGTHVAGLSAANTNNLVGVSSVSSGPRVMPLRIGYLTNDGNGSGFSSWMADAYIYAADNGADITNLSFTNGGELIRDAALYAMNQGVLIVTSGGNTDHEPSSSILPAQSWVLSVAALNPDDMITYYSGAGEYITVSAPGGEIYIGNDSNGLLSTVPYPSDLYGGEHYVRFQGTSMAAPVVASVAGLVKSHEPDINVVDLFTRVVGTTDNVDALNPGFEGLLGSGRVNVYRALTEEVSAEPEFKIVKSEILEDEGGNGNDKLDPGEDVTLRLTLRNWQEASSITAVLSTESEWPITVNSAVASPEDVPILSEIEVDFEISCAGDALPRAVDLNLNISGVGFEENIPCQVPISPQVLFIADFDGGTGDYLDFADVFIEALNANNISFDFIHHADAVISSDMLNNYLTVVWGCEWSFPTLDETDRTALEEFLGNGGSLFLSGQDIGWELNESVDNTDVNFFQDYLKSTYLADNAGTNQISGIEDDPISHGLELSFYQKKRATTQQFPDIIEPRETAESTLNYGVGLSSGGIRYVGDYRLVYFGFAGFEAIDDQDDREIIMARVVDLLDGIDIMHDPLKDTEDTVGDYIFKLSATADNDSISNVELYWSTDGVLPYTVVTMADSGNSNYEASIAAQEGGTTVHYFIYVETESETYAFSAEYSFEIGPDMVAPTLELTNPYITSTINVNGPAPYEFIFKINDNLGIDSTTAQLFFSVNESGLDSASLSYVEKDLFTGTFGFEEALNIGDEISYYAQVVDRSSNQNMGNTDTYTITIDTFQVIDDFEDGDWRWDLGLGWGLDDSNQESGEFSISDSPDGASYENNTKNSLTFGFPFNLRNFQFAQLDFYFKAQLISGDTLFVEVSTDYGETWNTAEVFARSSFSFRKQSINISAFTGEGMENVQIRYTLSTDDEGVENGVWIDDISITVSEVPLAIEEGDLTVPLTYNLKQNYPNPFNPSTTIQYSIPKTEQVELIIYNITGEKVKTVVSDKVEAGHHSVQWNGDNDHGRSVASGVYIYRIKTKGFTRSMKMLFLK